MVYRNLRTSVKERVGRAAFEEEAYEKDEAHEEEDEEADKREHGEGAEEHE